MAADPIEPNPKASILLVDDQPANLLALEAILENLGHHLVKARSGEQALRVLHEQDFAVILLDVQMPGMDGFDTAQQIRAQEKARHTPIIFLTAYEDHRFPVDKAYALGAVDYLLKPLVPVVLRAKVAGFVELFVKTEKIKSQAEQLRRVERREFEQRLAEENTRLGESEARFRAIIEQGWDAVALLTAEGLVSYASPSTTRILGYAVAEFVGQNVFALIHPDDRAMTQQLFANILHQPRGVLTAQFRFQHQDGSWRWVDGTATNLLSEAGVRAVVANYRDITEQKKLQEALRERAERLLEADRRKDEFLAMLSHELRNPLAPICNAVQVMRLLGSRDPNLQRSRETIERQVNHLTRLVDDLLEVSRISRGKIALQKEALDLTPVIARAVETSRPLIEAHRHELTVRLPAEAVVVEGDPTRLAQVVANLLNNAAKYTSDGGRIGVEVEKHDNEAVVRVWDRGMGIPADLLPHVFDLFTQGDRSLARSEGGLGIGLTLVKSLVEMHGGRVDAFSEGPGRGSEFVVWLPILERRRVQPSSPGQPGPRQPHGPSRRILVVDDSEDTAHSLAFLLKIEGHEVRTAHDGPTAFETAQAFQPEVVLLDIGLPKMDGYEVARRLREQGGQPQPFLIAITGYGQADDRRRAGEAGFDAHLVKPADLAALHELLAHVGANS